MLPVREKAVKCHYWVRVFYGRTGRDDHPAKTLNSAERLARKKLSAACSGTWVEIFDCALQKTVKTLGKNADNSLSEIMNNPPIK